MEVSGLAPDAKITLDDRVVAAAAAGKVLEGEIEARAERLFESGLVQSVSPRGGAWRIFVCDVVCRFPTARVIGEQPVRSELVPQPHHRPREAANGFR